MGSPVINFDDQNEDPESYNPLDPSNAFNTRRKAMQMQPDMSYGSQPGDYGQTANFGSTPSPAQERYQQIAGEAQKMKLEGHDPYTAQPAWWRTLIAAAAQFGTRRNPALGKTIADAVTGHDPNVMAAQSYFGQKADAKQAADEERQQQAMQQTAQYHKLIADNNRIRAAGTAQNQRSMEQARLETADKAKRGEGFQQYEGLPQLAPPSQAAQAPTVTPQANGLPPLLGPGQAPISAPVRSAMAANAPPAPTNRIAGYTPTALSTGQQGQIPTEEDRKNSELISQDLAEKAGMSGPAGSQGQGMALQRVPPAERTRLETIAQQRAAAEEGKWEVKTETDDKGNVNVFRVNSKTGEVKPATNVGKLGKSKAEPGAAGGQLTPEGIDLAAYQYYKTGQMPPLGMGASPYRSQIINRAAEFAKQESAGPADVVSGRAGYKADTASLTALQRNRDAVVTFEQTAGKNLDLFMKQAKPVIDSGSPWINQPLRSVSAGALGNADIPAFNAARQVAINEIAKVTSNPGLSGQLSDAARREVEAFIPATATLKQIYSVANVLKQDMANRHQSMDAMLGEVKGRIKGGPPAPETNAPSAAPKVIKWGRDAQGNPVPLNQ